MSIVRTVASKLLLVALVVGLAGPTSLAQETKSATVIAPNGDLFQVQEVVDESGGISKSLRATIYRINGEVRTHDILLTADDLYDTSPSLALDPDTLQPALVWSRYNGFDFDIVMSVFDGSRWGPRIPLANTGSNEVEPKAFTAPGQGLHVIWAWPDEPKAFGYGLFRTATGVAIRGPEKVTPANPLRARGSRVTGRRGNRSAEGGLDDPGNFNNDPDVDGTGSTDGSSGNSTPQPSRGPGSGRESGTVFCNNEFTVTIETRAGVCVLIRDDTTWIQRCYPRRVSGEAVLQSLQKLVGSTCEPY